MVAYFDHIDNLCGQSEELALVDTVVEVVGKNPLPMYQEQLATAGTLNDLGGREACWDYQRLRAYLVTWERF